ncbi:MAG: hypothetical protein KKA64_03210 [Nanoarchaeota archaeon]|nr:hypothetical protein [Nanoarchaeota archaeon]
MQSQDGRIPSFHIIADSIPEAHYKAIESVWNNGIQIRTQYDRKNSKGEYIEPPSRDASVLIEIKNPFSEPRFPPTSFCEIGKYILEMMGGKNHLVIPRNKLLKGIEENNLESKWPYAYNQRLTEYPSSLGELNQIESAVSRIAESYFTRRAVMTTRCPEIDMNLKEDIPCLGEMHLRCPKNEQGSLVLNLTSSWRSRDLFKAWPDNVIGITYLGKRKIAKQIEEKTGISTKLGSYKDFSYSLHIYGQDFTRIEGDKEIGKKSFFEIFPNVESYIKRSMTSETARDILILPQMKELLNEEQIKQWDFTGKEIKIILEEIGYLESGGLP